MRTLKRLFTTLFLLCLVEIATAQDVIVKKDQTTVMSKVLEITSTEIKYKKWSNQDGPTYSINRSEVLSINFENGEVERFSGNAISQPNTILETTQITNKGFMDCSGTWLSLNGRILSEKEIQSLVSEEDYELYLKGKRQYSAGSVLSTIGGILAGAGLGAMLGLLDKPNAMGIALGIGLGGVALAIPGIPLSVVGSNNLKQVASNYTYGTPYSLNLSPSMIKCGMPQSQGNYCMGLTLSMNF